MPGPFRLLSRASGLIACWLGVLCNPSAAAPLVWSLVSDTQGRFVIDIDFFIPDPDSIFVLTADALLLSSDGGSRWDSAAPGACCGVLALSTVNSAHLFMNQTGIPFPGNSLCGSTDRGGNWSEITHGLCAGYSTCAANIFKRGPAPANSLFASLNPYVLLRTNNNGVTWDSVMIPPNYGFWAVEISNQDPDVMYIAYGTPVRLYRSDDGGLSWQQLPFPAIAGDTAIFLAVDPRDDNVVYAAVRRTGVFKTLDGGGQWFLVNQGLYEENLLFNTLTLNPHDPDELFLGVVDSVADDGESSLVFFTDDAGASWSSLSEGLAVAGHVTSLTIDPAGFRVFAGVNTLEGSTSGVYALGPAMTVAAGAPIAPPILLQNSPNPFNAETTIRFVLADRTVVRICVYTLIGELVAVLLEDSMEAGEHEVTFNAGELASGVYLYTLDVGGRGRARRMVLLR